MELEEWETVRRYTVNYSLQLRINFLKDVEKVFRFQTMKLRRCNQNFKFRFLVTVFQNGVNEETEGWLVVLRDVRIPKHEPRPRDYGILSYTVSVIDIEGNSRLPRSFVEIPSEEDDRYPKYLERSVILNRKDEFLSEGVLTVRCDIHFYINTIFSEGMIHRILKDYLCSIPQEFCYKDKAQTRDPEHISKRAQIGDTQHISKRAQTGDHVSKRAPTGDPEDVSKTAQTGDPEDISKRAPTEDPENVFKRAQTEDPEDVSKRVPTGDPEDVFKGAQTEDKEDVSKKAQTGEPEDISKRAQTGDSEDISKRDRRNEFTIFDFTHQILTLPDFHESRRRFGISSTKSSCSSDSEEDSRGILEHVWIFDTETVRFLVSLDERQDGVGARLLKASPVIRRCINAPMKERIEKRIHFPDVSSRTFVIVLFFLERGTLPTSPNRDFLGVYQFSHFYEMEVLQRKCAEEMVKSVEFSTEELKRIADNYSDDYLSELMVSRWNENEDSEQPRFRIYERLNSDSYI